MIIGIFFDGKMQRHDTTHTYHAEIGVFL